MSDAQLVRLGRAMALVGIGAATTVMATHLILGVVDVTFDSFNLHTALFATVLGAVGLAAVGRQPRNVAVWMVLGAILFAAIELLSWSVVAAWTVADQGADFYRSLVSGGSPADIQNTVAWVFWLAWWAWLPAFLGFMTLGLLWFPQGRLPSPRWRWAAAVAGVGLLLTVTGHAIVFRPGSTVPYETTSNYPGFGGLLINVGFPILVAASLATAASLIVRYRAGDSVVRHQLRWIGLGAAAVGVSFAVFIFVGSTALAAATLVTLPVFLGGYGVAILKYRLYDVDVVISRAVTYGALAMIIAGLYALMVVGIGSLLGRGDEPDLTLSVVATALIAVLFEPIHRRVSRLANRLVYGQRATPYGVLSTLTARLGAAENPEMALDQLAELVARGAGAATAGVWLQVGDDLRPAAAWPPASPPPAPTDAALSVPVSEGGEILGALTITKARTDPVTEADRRLLADVAAGCGLLVRNMRLNAELTARAEQLRASRRRLVAAQDAERQRLERDLHDGAQQQVVALKVKLGLARTLAEREGAADVAALVTGLADETQGAVDSMRIVARGIYPPLLDAEGLPAALASARRASRIPVEVETGGIGRYSRHVEETVYFCVLEAIEAATMSGAHGLRVGVAERNGEVVVEVDHDGRAAESDFAAVSDRVDAFGGSTEIDLLPGVGARVTSRIPAADHVMEPA